MPFYGKPNAKKYLTKCTEQINKIPYTNTYKEKKTSVKQKSNQNKKNYISE